MLRPTCRHLVFCLFFLSPFFAFAEDKNERVLVIPEAEIRNAYGCKLESLQKAHSKYVNSYEGKKLWTFMNDSKTKDAGFAMAQSSPQPCITNKPENDLAAFCYRCGLKRSDLVNRKDCEESNYKWGVSSLEELTACD